MLYARGLFSNTRSCYCTNLDKGDKEGVTPSPLMTQSSGHNNFEGRFEQADEQIEQTEQTCLPCLTLSELRQRPQSPPLFPASSTDMPLPTASELIFSEQANHNFSKTLGELKRSTLSIQNRLQSILHDAAFAQRVAVAYGRPLIANERCGSWYIDPETKGGSAYFKSTDGHTGVWKFSLRRLNLHLLEIIGKHDGLVAFFERRRIELK